MQEARGKRQEVIGKRQAARPLRSGTPCVLRGLIVGLACSFVFLTGVARAQGITVTNTSAEYVFAQQMTFHVVAKSDAVIKTATVFMRARNLAEIRVAGVFAPDKKIDVTFVQPLAGGVLPPFSTVTYWWELTDANGNKHVTPSQSVEYLDNRFGWQDISEGNVRVRSYAGDVSYARSALDVARAALPRINQELEAPLPPRVDIYLYSSPDELQSAMLLSGREWLGGQARPELGVVLAAVPTGQAALAQMKRDLPHELTHLLVFQATGAGYARVPRWLDEGLASANEELAQPAYQLVLEAAVRSGQLLPLETLCAPFSTDAGAAQLAYAQSQSLVQHIRNTFPDGVRKLLGAYAGGATCGGGVEQALGATLSALEWKWRASLAPQGTWQSFNSSVAPWVVLALMVSLALLPFAFVRRKRRVA
jgi:hypothetical protein